MRALVIGGAGSIGQKHFANLKLLGVESWVSDIKYPHSPLDDFDLTEFDLAIIATPTSTHLSILNYVDGKVPYIMVEKPLTNSWKGMIKPIYPDYKSQVFVNYPYRFERGIKKLKEKMHKVGKLQHAVMEDSYDYDIMHPQIPFGNYDGILLDDIHLINTSRYLFGDPLHIFSGYARKEIAEWTWQAQELIVSHSTDVLNVRYKKRIEVRGDKGTLIWNYHGHELWFAPKGGGPRKAIAYKFADHLFEALKYVVETVKNKDKFDPNDLIEAAYDIELAEEIIEKGSNYGCQ